MALREILAKFGFEYDKAKLREVDAGVEKTKGTLQGVLATLAGAVFFNGVKNFIHGIEQLGSGLNDLSEQTGAGTESIQLFQFVTGQAGVEAEESAASIRKLSVTIGNAASGGAEQAKAFNELGIAFKDSQGHARSLDDVLPELFESFGKITDDAKASRLAVDLFGRSGVKMLGALKQGKAGFEAYREEFEALGGGMSAEAIAAADEYGDSLFKLNFAFTGMKSIIGAEVFPILTELVGHFTDMVAFARRFTKDTNLVKAAMVSLSIVGVAAITALLGPFAPIIAAVGALTLVIDDFISFLKGEDSLIGAIFNDLFGKETTSKIRAGLLDVGEEVKAFFEDLIKHPKKFVEDMTLLFKGISSDVRKFLGLSSEAESKVDRGVAVTPQQQAQADSDRAFFESLPETFGSKGLSKMIVQDKYINDIFGRENVLGWFGKNSDGSNKGNAAQPAPVMMPGGWATPEPMQPSPAWDSTQGKGTAEPVPVALSKPPDDWFSGLANSFGSIFGIEPGAVAPAQVAVPGQAAGATNTLEQTNHNHFHLTTETPEELKAAVEQGATNALGNERRNAQMALEQAGGG
jgi:hypothetical protein